MVQQSFKQQNCKSGEICLLALIFANVATLPSTTTSSRVLMFSQIPGSENLLKEVGYTTVELQVTIPLPQYETATEIFSILSE